MIHRKKKDTHQDPLLLGFGLDSSLREVLRGVSACGCWSHPHSPEVRTPSSAREVSRAPAAAAWKASPAPRTQARGEEGRFEAERWTHLELIS